MHLARLALHPLYAAARRPALTWSTAEALDTREKPEGATNYIKTNAGQGWFPYFRFYGPTEAYFDKSWQLNDIEAHAK